MVFAAFWELPEKKLNMVVGVTKTGRIFYESRRLVWV